MRWYHLTGLASAISLNILVLTTIYYPSSFNERGIACIATNYYGEHWIEFIGLTLCFFGLLDFIRLDILGKIKNKRDKAQEKEKPKTKEYSIEGEYIRVSE